MSKSTFYSNHITLNGPIATSFLKSKAFTKHRLGKMKPHKQIWHEKSDPENTVNQGDPMKHDAESSITS